MIGKTVKIFDCVEWPGAGIGKVLSYDRYGGGFYILDYADINQPPEFQNCRFVRPENLMVISFDKPQDMWYRLKVSLNVLKKKIAIKLRFLFRL